MFTCLHGQLPIKIRGGGRPGPHNMFLRFFSDIFSSNTSKITDFFIFLVVFYIFEEKHYFVHLRWALRPIRHA